MTNTKRNWSAPSTTRPSPRSTTAAGAQHVSPKVTAVQRSTERDTGSCTRPGADQMSALLRTPLHSPANPARTGPSGLCSPPEGQIGSILVRCPILLPPSVRFSVLRGEPDRSLRPCPARRGSTHGGAPPVPCRGSRGRRIRRNPAGSCCTWAKRRHCISGWCRTTSSGQADRAPCAVRWPGC